MRWWVSATCFAATTAWAYTPWRPWNRSASIPGSAWTYIAEDYRNLMPCLYAAHAAVIIQADAVTGRSGDVHDLDLDRFRTLAALDHRIPSRHMALAEMLGTIETAHRLPQQLRIVLVDPDPTRDSHGACLSPAARRGVRRAVELAACFLEQCGALFEC